MKMSYSITPCCAKYLTFWNEIRYFAWKMVELQKTTAVTYCICRAIHKEFMTVFTKAKARI